MNSMKRITFTRKYPSLLQFMKFGMVGVFNTIIYFMVYYGGLWIGIHYMIANILGWIVSVFNAFYWNRRYVFQSDGSWLRTLMRTYIAYGVSLVANGVFLFLLVETLGFSDWVAPWIVVVLMVPFSFFLNKLWTFR